MTKVDDALKEFLGAVAELLAKDVLRDLDGGEEEETSTVVVGI